MKLRASVSGSIKLNKFNLALKILSASCLPRPVSRFKTLAAVTEIGGDIKKFSSLPKLVAYAGLYPKSRQSGKPYVPASAS